MSSCVNDKNQRCPHNPSCAALVGTAQVLNQFGDQSTVEDVRHYVTTTLARRARGTKP